MGKEGHWKLHLVVGLVLSLLFAFGGILLIMALSAYLAFTFGIWVGIGFLAAFPGSFPFLYKTRAYQRIIKPYKKWDSLYWSRVNERRITILAFSLIGGYAIILTALILVTFNWLGLPSDTSLWISFGIPTIASIVTVVKLERRGWFYKKRQLD